MQTTSSNSNRLGERGAVAVYTAIILTVLIGFGALAVDIGYLYGVKNELHNAADAGALAGASKLFDPKTGNLTVTAAVLEAQRIVPLNKTGTEPVKVYAVDGVETGHWSFTTKTFTPSANTTQVAWQERTFSELDGDPAFINAVRVRTERAETPSFLARIFDLDSFFLSSSAVAYIGFAGTMYPGDFDQPIAICKESITAGGHYSCNMGRMLNSGNNADTANTGAWTNFTQPCDTASQSDMSDLVCKKGNTTQVVFGQGIGSTGGVQDDVTFRQLQDCWEATTNRKTPWELTLPVVECPGNNVSNCAELVGAVTVNVLWMIRDGKINGNNAYDEVPSLMEKVPGKSNWQCTDSDKFVCWKSFVNHFGLRNVSGKTPTSADDYEELYMGKNIYFLPACTAHEPVGTTGGENFGILARIPVLVQ